MHGGDGLAGPAAAGPPAPAAWPSPAGRVTSSRLPCTSTVIRSRAGAAPAAASGPSNGGICPVNSVSIHRVCTANGSLVNAGSVTTARWKGSTVGMPPTSNSASARRARASACGRSAPVTISLASSESNACGTVMPCR